jgi:hypothetical protein
MFAGQLAGAAGRQRSARHLLRRDAAGAAFAARVGCEAAPSFAAAVEDQRVKAVLLATPNAGHAEQGAAAAALGKHVFVEKPIADTLADGRALRAACLEAGVALLVGHDLRRLGAARAAKALVDEGALGTVVLAELNFSLTGTLKPESWRYRRETCLAGRRCSSASTMRTRSSTGSARRRACTGRSPGSSRRPRSTTSGSHRRAGVGSARDDRVELRLAEDVLGEAPRHGRGSRVRRRRLRLAPGGAPRRGDHAPTDGRGGHAGGRLRRARPGRRGAGGARALHARRPAETGAEEALPRWP